MAFCKACGAAIEWHKTPAGKNIPVDPDPHPQGNLYVDDRACMAVGPVGSHAKMFRSHFVTCPEAGKFRRSR